MCLGHFSELQSSGRNKNMVLRISRSLQMCGLFRWGGAVAVVLWISWQGLSAALLCQEGLLLMFHHDVSVPLHALASVAECCYCGMGVVHIMTLRAGRVLLCPYRATCQNRVAANVDTWSSDACPSIGTLHYCLRWQTAVSVGWGVLWVVALGADQAFWCQPGQHIRTGMYLWEAANAT